MTHLLDLHHDGIPEAIAAYALPTGRGGFALVDPGPGSTLPRLEAAIAELGLELAALTAVFVSHVHLDHAGAAGALARRSGATVVAHPRAAPHLADPTRLLASARRVYGGHMEALWGEMEPVPAGHLRVVQDGETFAVGRLKVRVLEAPGHARHQHAYLTADGRLFPGDAAAIRLPRCRTLMPATAPPEIDLEAWADTLDKIRAAAPSVLLLPHFGPKGDVQDHLSRLRTELPAWAQVVRNGLALGEHERALADRLETYLRAQLAEEGAPDETVARNLRAAGPMMCVLGLRRYLELADGRGG